MDDIKLFAKNESGMDILIQAVRIYSKDMGMEFSREKLAMKRLMADGMKLPNQEIIRTLEEKDTYKYLGILESDTIKQVEMGKNYKRSISGERESYSKSNYILGTI